MDLGRLFGYYILWHYTAAFADILQIFKNFLWFFYNFFSIPLLLKTLFSPLERLHESYGGDFDIGAFFSTLAVNILMRIVGAVLRLFVIVLGIAVLTTTFALGIAFIAIWLVLPALVPISFFGGIGILLM